ncbi:MAG: type II methionyl aminopeptidase [Thermoprotei archaeon]|nr:type II methionyl aminopeptidase [Thermoprotei archaeon]
MLSEVLDVDKLKAAGRIAVASREYAVGLVKPGALVLDVCESIERFIVESGGLPAFPCNLSINEVAAHYTPGLGDSSVIPEGAVVKVDIGVHVDGFIVDTAATVDLSGEYGKLLETTVRALEEAVSVVKPYVSLYDIGRVIERAVRDGGFKPIRNLSGHNIGRYIVHAGLSIPNVADRSLYRLRIQPGTLIALEPFATNGKGLVVDGPTINIYSYTGRGPKMGLTSLEAELLDYVSREYRTLPFAARWLRNWKGGDVEGLLKLLHSKGVLHGYPVLIEAGRGVVAQFEHTVLVTESDVIVLA